MNVLGRRRIAVPLLSLGLCLAVANPVPAWQIDWAAGGSMEFTDNIRRTATDTRSDQIGVLWAGAWIQEDTPTLQLGLSSLLEYHDYQRGTYDDELLFRLSALATASLIPQRLHWVVEDYFRQVRVDDLSPVTPDNRQDTNVFWTGPDAFFHFGPSTELRLGARAGHYYYSELDADNFRYAGNARLTRQLRPRLEGWLSADAMRVDYDNDDEYIDFDRYDGSAGLRFYMPRSELRAEAGNTWIERDNADNLERGFVALELTRRLPDDAVGRASYTQRYTEGGATLLAAGSDPMRAELASATRPRDIVYERRVDLHYARRFGNIDTIMAAHWWDEDFTTDPLDRVSVGGRLDLGLRITYDWLVGAYLAYRHVDYDLVSREDDDWLLGARVEHRFTQQATGAVEVIHDRRDSTVGAAEYEENILILSLRYGERPPEVPR
ncbi:hypothetical protein CAI21_19945 [Alkalilimnicola ehrlichii]|uniref:TIGR03016 family PEP-CTERM system-associated outer membrane protein n=1 Tax=Alkalilimnicola ehrlichii TaxID=351052 RepID=A0A3E0WIZ4_9GAMM|nr:hypothetical protein [Alkalilimnicola ehrlichii]RFA25166.1 hypothetical protein CAI21_19945 [Alkalilimnicola ehrlichii]RFA32121.1 hypothetical protein CAL65_20530 [Alkalilimnicola ehrlichii]